MESELEFISNMMNTLSNPINETLISKNSKTENKNEIKKRSELAGPIFNRIFEMKFDEIETKTKDSFLLKIENAGLKKRRYQADARFQLLKKQYKETIVNLNKIIAYRNDFSKIVNKKNFVLSFKRRLNKGQWQLGLPWSNLIIKRQVKTFEKNFVKS